jgi:hypothetical protein
MSHSERKKAMTTLSELLRSGELKQQFTMSAIKSIRDSVRLATQKNSEIVTVSHLVVILFILDHSADVGYAELPDSVDEPEDQFKLIPTRPTPLPYDPIPTDGFRDTLNIALKTAEDFELPLVNNMILWLGAMNKEGDEGLDVMLALGINVPDFRDKIVKEISAPVPPIILLDDLRQQGLTG